MDLIVEKNSTRSPLLSIAEIEEFYNSGKSDEESMDKEKCQKVSIWKDLLRKLGKPCYVSVLKHWLDNLSSVWDRPIALDGLSSVRTYPSSE